MSEIRRDKVLKVADSLPPTEIFGDEEGDLLVVGWGGTYGAIHQGVAQMRSAVTRSATCICAGSAPFPRPR